MTNCTPVSYFVLSAYFDIGAFRYLLFMIVKLLYAAIICSNVLLVVVICMNRSLHEPMYLFLCSLFVNELYGSTGLFPFLLLQILSDVHTVSTSFYFMQVFVLYSYANVEFINLAVMSYDRYLAICHPLHYRARMTSVKIALLIALIWFFPFVEVGVMVSLSASLQLSGNMVHKVYCDNFSITRLACSDATANNIYGIIYSFVIVFSVMTVFLYTYTRIVRVCFTGSKQMRQKAISTCTPHLASFINFVFGGFFEVMQNRFDTSSIPQIIRIVLSVYFVTCQPLFNPLLYGLRMSKIQSTCKRLLRSRR